MKGCRAMIPAAHGVFFMRSPISISNLSRALRMPSAQWQYYIWLVTALGLLIRKATVYDRQVFKSWYRSQSVCIGLTQAAASCARTVQHCAGVVVFCHYHAKVVGIKLLFTGQECVELRIP